MDKVRELITRLGLEPLPGEGGYYVETYRSSTVVPNLAGYTGGRSLATAIYYLLTSDTVSAMHRLPNDEVFHFYLGDPVEMLHLLPDGSGMVVALGSDILGGMSPQVLVPGGTWQGARLMAGGEFALMGTTVSPGFEFTDYEHGSCEELIATYPKFNEIIRALTEG